MTIIVNTTSQGSAAATKMLNHLEWPYLRSCKLIQQLIIQFPYKLSATTQPESVIIIIDGVRSLWWVGCANKRKFKYVATICLGVIPKLFLIVVCECRWITHSLIPYHMCFAFCEKNSSQRTLWRHQYILVAFWICIQCQLHCLERVITTNYEKW